MYQDYLWAPHRMEWITGKKPKGCVLCRIAKGDAKVPTRKLHQDGKVMVIMNVFPYNVGHLQVVPVRHVSWPEELSQEEFSDFNQMHVRAIRLLRKALKPVGFNTGMNLGERSGQSIEHLHYQIVPRYGKETGFMEAISGTKVMPETLEQTHRRLMKHADVLKG